MFRGNTFFMYSYLFDNLFVACCFERDSRQCTIFDKIIIILISAVNVKNDVFFVIYSECIAR